MFFEIGKNLVFVVKIYCFIINLKNLFYELVVVELISVFFGLIIMFFII